MRDARRLPRRRDRPAQWSLRGVAPARVRPGAAPYPIPSTPMARARRGWCCAATRHWPDRNEDAFTPLLRRGTQRPATTYPARRGARAARGLPPAGAVGAGFQKAVPVPRAARAERAGRHTAWRGSTGTCRWPSRRRARCSPSSSARSRSPRGRRRRRPRECRGRTLGAPEGDAWRCHGPAGGAQGGPQSAVPLRQRPQVQGLSRREGARPC